MILLSIQAVIETSLVCETIINKKKNTQKTNSLRVQATTK